jgi:multidrug efflux pump subunit AcrB
VPGIAHAVNLVGFSGATFTNAPNSGTVFVTLEPFEKRAKDPRKSGPALQAALLQKLSVIQEGLVLVIAPPPVRGIGTAGGFRMMVEDRGGRGPDALRAESTRTYAKRREWQRFRAFSDDVPCLPLGRW